MLFRWLSGDASVAMDRLDADEPVGRVGARARVGVGARARARVRVSVGVGVRVRVRVSSP